MREVKSIAETLRGHVKVLRDRAQITTESFKREMATAHDSISKLESLTDELKDANREVEAALADVGTNFPPKEENEPTVKPDLNGVTLAKG